MVERLNRERSLQSGKKPTVAIMTVMKAKQIFWLRWNAPEWHTFEREAGFRKFEESFLAFPFRMIVVGPDFSKFDRRYEQTFAYLPLSAFGAGRVPAPERAFLQKCIERIRPERTGPGETGEIVYIDGVFVADRKAGVGVEWTAPFDVVERSAKVISKRTCLDRIMPALETGIGPEEGGLYTPYAGEGVFHLLSM